jgi:transposase InsO family protein
MDENKQKIAKASRAKTWGEFRFSVIGQLLASPPESGNLEAEIIELSKKSWIHPITGSSRKFSFSSIERWYYTARKNSTNPVEGLHKKTRADKGNGRAITEEVKIVLKKQYSEHRYWSYKLHSDNITSALKQAKQEDAPSYPTVRRYLQSIGCFKEKYNRNKNRVGYQKSLYKKDHFEIRGYENEFVSGLWHLDFHHCSREVITSTGELKRPLVLGIIDDHSRLLCHIQWYWSESAENLVHGFTQALQKRGIPRSLMSDNGSAMTSGEFTSGLKNLGILHQLTLPYSPYQNGKQEVLWGQLEGRLMAMMENKKHITLKELNDMTLAWAEIEYNKANHTEIKTSPLNRFLNNRDVGRKCPPIEELKNAFREETTRSVRKSDATISIEGKRYEIPYQYRHLPRVTVRYAKWDLTLVHLVDDNSGKNICQISPVNKTKNGDGSRKLFNPHDEKKVIEVDGEGEVAPLLLEILATQAQTGLPPAYIPKDE